ncbi:MAG: hypothetical protein CMC08_01600 [Flavobacteriaceae bacterium]|nr:hypothetical protein [Flavobacteriaceae bacterium]|tara:strand:+ start:143 stop:1330 length:1188 start_codon:yes stop_codon:yes gene_type:complete
MFDKKSKNILLLFGAVLLLLFISQVSRPTPVNWAASYTSEDKIPFGSYILHEELPILFPEANVVEIRKDPFEFLTEVTDNRPSAYIFINDALQIDANQVTALRDYVTAGNTVFMSARSLGTLLEDSLKFTLHTRYSVLESDLEPAFFSLREKSDSISKFKKGVYKATFKSVDTANTTAIGFYKSTENPIDALNFIEIAHGQGKFLLHTLPEAFSNYYLLAGNASYASTVFSYIDADQIYLDAYLKSGRKIVSTPLRFILTQGALKWSLYLLLFGLIVLVIFKAKREQRIIKVMEPLTNSSIDFTKAVGQLYYQHKDSGNIINKKISFVLEDIRSLYYMNTDLLDDDFIHKLSLKSGASFRTTKKLVECIAHLQTKMDHTESDLNELNQRIQDFKN